MFGGAVFIVYFLLADILVGQTNVGITSVLSVMSNVGLLVYSLLCPI